MTWTLIILVSVGAFSKSEANAVSSVSGFTSAQACATAGKQVKSLQHGYKEVRSICVAMQ